MLVSLSVVVTSSFEFRDEGLDCERLNFGGTVGPLSFIVTLFDARDGGLETGANFA
jgi:hypothetical protein